MKRTILVVACILSFYTINSQNICLTPLEKEVVDLINSQRVENGLNPVIISPVLMLTANKNVEEIVTQSYLNFKPEKFGEYNSEYSQIRYSSSSNDAARIVKSLTTPSSYTNYHKIVLNTDEFASNNWSGFGICIRSGNIVLIFGEQAEKKVDIDICESERFFEPQEVIKYPVLSIYVPQDAIIRVYATLYEGGDVIELEYLSSNIDKGQTFKLDLDYSGYESFDVIVKPAIPPIVPIEDILISVLSSSNGISEHKIEFNGNTVEEIGNYLKAGGSVNDVEEFDPNGYCMLHRAVMHDNIEAVKFLFTNGADVNQLSSDNENAMSFVKSSEMFDILMSKNPNLNVPNFDKITLLHSYAISNLLEPVKFLVEEKAFDINATDRSGGTPIIYAVQFKSYQVAEYLLSKGALQSKGWGIYPIHDAVMNNDLEMLKLLVKYGADVNSKDDSGYTPLYKALNYTDENEDIIEYLRSIGAE